MLTEDNGTTNNSQPIIFSSESSTKLISMDSNRNYRRLIPGKEVEFSSQSIMKSMESFVQAVKEMDETILVPSRLMDLEVGDSADVDSLKAASAASNNAGKKKGTTAAPERDNLSTTDLYRLYNMVNSVRKELLWGGDATTTTPPEEDVVETETSSTTSVGGGQQQRKRRTSLVSLSSSQSLSDTDSEAGNENDSGIEGDQADAKPDYTVKLEEGFRRHLNGLQRSLSAMTAAANYLSARYQKDISAKV